MNPRRPEPDRSPPDEPSEDAPRTPWRRALVWVERIVTAALLVFVLVRLGPQLGALTGVGPALGSAPDVDYVTLDGDTIPSRTLMGNVVVVNFWATWCGPCKLEMPSLQKVHEGRAGDGVVVIGLSTDVGGETAVRAFLEERGITYPVGFATHAHRRAFGGLPGTPTTIIIDREGIVRHKVFGYFAPPALNAAVGRLADG